MYCRKCNNVISEDMNYCPHCGTSTQYKDDGMVSQIGGYYEPIGQQLYPVEENEVYEFGKKQQRPFSKKKILILSLIIVIITMIGFGYTSVQPYLSDLIEVPSEQNLNVGSLGNESHVGNINRGGKVITYGDMVYVINIEGQIVRMDTSFENHKIIIDTPSQYLNIDDDVLWFVDENYHLWNASLEGTNKTQILEDDIYYPVFANGILYFQLDKDNESIYKMNMDDYSIKKLNDRQSYNINVVGNVIYYTGSSGIYRMSTDGQGDTLIVDTPTVNLIYQDHYLYYFDTNNYTINRCDTSTYRVEVIIEDVADMSNMSSEAIYYYTRQGILYEYNIESTSIIEVARVYYNEVYVIGDKLFIYDSSMAERGIIIDPKTGQYKTIIVPQIGDYV